MLKARPLFIALLFILTGCAQPIFYEEPEAAEETLLMGIATLKVLHSTDMRAVGEGTHHWGITLYFRRTGSEDLIEVPCTDETGFFYIRNPEPGTYTITKMLFTDSRGSYVRFRIPSSSKFEVVAGRINNLGEFKWISDLDKGETRSAYFLNQTETRNLFAKQFPQSKWLAREWVDVKKQEKPTTGTSE